MTDTVIQTGHHTRLTTPFDEIPDYSHIRRAWVSNGTTWVEQKSIKFSDGTSWSAEMWPVVFDTPSLAAADTSACAGPGHIINSIHAEWHNEHGNAVTLRFYTQEFGVYTLRETLTNAFLPVDGAGISRHDFEYDAGVATPVTNMKVELEFLSRGFTSSTFTATAGTTILTC
jgi:hypothetical protein